MKLSERHLVLAGPMAAGKTTLGRILARRLGRRFIDSDEQIAKRMGMTSRELAATEGVDVLHELEGRMLIDALREQEPAVIAAAASIADSPETVMALGNSDAALVLVEAPTPTLFDRLSRPGHRREITAAEFAVLTRERRQVLTGLSPSVSVDTSVQEPEESADTVLRAFGEAGDNR